VRYGLEDVLTSLEVYLNGPDSKLGRYHSGWRQASPARKQ